MMISSPLRYKNTNMKNDYKFNEKWFQDVKGGWDQCFDWYVNKQEREVRDVLEVGCYEGMASIYLAENYLKGWSKLYCSRYI